MLFDINILQKEINDEHLRIVLISDKESTYFKLQQHKLEMLINDYNELLKLVK